ncbi:MAG: vitamin B12-dependent ribonucleotide reductase [Bacillaceae bacterium]|jgi:ribonucleoside-diphosphate reductase, adenosylcobalamin-dependent|uniref:Vitamin B12-dependent ribonucleotide reductase n=2 Tax=Aeribacillus TaxID=1055323 RepID=A0A165XS14_9BACI|nr:MULTISPECIES: vitamin B12-dependent ribonucleotide reductase [Aeribacillus]AXI40122.1 ribonucleoside-diphosphate reductase, adenosylcobalamin-dependent [Bacillaceae bacterium ZC4]REJ18527.1 MAG: vitamin B12-dependent ribonucleotide reductase [Bacillaceae bacterium]ASS91886.1 ribonucleoside-diphosphate reductase, adenosylcobalamin-dependent [Aeribacillus pallidus]AXI40125.1 ribonucleoside-diphosphate reductase, adenosylcobalamin-dependent [Bacillaceae bacterium ZC4]KZM56819.1 ribonucleotide-
MTVALNEKMKIDVEKLNKDISLFPQVHPITEDMKITHKGVSRLVMLDRYSFKDTEKITLSEGDFVVLTIKEDPKFPARGLGYIKEIDWENKKAKVQVEEEFRHTLEKPEERETGIIVRSLDVIEKPLEIFYEQIAKRNATGLAAVEKTEEKRKEWFEKFYQELVNLHFIPAGRVLYGAGAGTEVTYFNCYVMPFVKDSREGISEHRKQVMEIMSRGGGVGTNGSTLRPRNTLARGVNGKSSGSVSWLDDIAKLTHLVEQGGSRRGAQMIMLADWHPDIIEFIVSKMQNPRILRYLIENTNDEGIKKAAEDKLKFVPLTQQERDMYQGIVNFKNVPGKGGFSDAVIREAELKLRVGGTYTVHNPEFLTGANISVCLTKEFMEAVEEDREYELRFPDVESYNDEEMKIYNEEWHKVGDVREWEKMGHRVRVYRKIRARELWKLINICATYSAEPGIFFIDNANDMTNARAYGQKVVATNPCGEQPLAPYSVCNLAAVNLAKMVDKEKKAVDYEKLKRTVEIGVRMQDNVIDATPYFLEENKKQALGERRIGLGVMGLADLLIYCEKEYGAEDGNKLVDEVFKVIATTAYRASIELAKEKGSFPFLVGETEEETQKLRQAFINTGYMKKMPEDIRENILKYGIRNSHLLTVAPTGSTGTMVGVSTGLEPYFSFSYYRSGRLGKFIEVKADIVQEYLNEHPEADPNHLPHWFVSAMDLSPEAHADVQCIIQRWVDSSLSKTVNAPKGYTVDQVQKVYERLWKGGAKGGTVYVDGSRDTQVLTLKAEENVLNDDIPESTKENEGKVVLMNTVQDLRSTDVTYGNEVGNTCPVCREGKVQEIGGCNTCTKCGAQLKCGL